jgi:hypothetical protein
MSKKPYLSDEVELQKIDFSDVKYNENKPFCNVMYGKPEETLYLQSPIFRFIHPVTIQSIGGKKYNELYLFLTPLDQSTFPFIKLITLIENMSYDHVTKLPKMEQYKLSQIIKTSEVENNGSKQLIKYIKIKLLNQTKIEYNKKIINIDDLNTLINKVNLKLIFDMNMLWLTQNKFGLYLKPLRIKAVDIVEDQLVEFRDEDEIIQNDALLTEGDIKNVIKGQSLNDSVFKTDIFIGKKINNEIKIEHIQEQTNRTDNFSNFIPSASVDNKITKTSVKTSVKSPVKSSVKSPIKPHNDSDSDDMKSSSSIKLEKFSRKKKTPKKTENNLGALKQLLDDADKNDTDDDSSLSIDKLN